MSNSQNIGENIKTVRDEESRFSGVPLISGYTVDPESGLLKQERSKTVNYAPVFCRKGTAVRARIPEMKFRVFAYKDEIDPQWVRRYDYAPEGNWTLYAPAASGSVRECDRWISEKDGYYRFVFEDSPDAGRLGDVLEAEFQQVTPAEEIPAWISEEAENLAGRIRQQGLLSGLRLFLLADSHYAVGGNWQDTQESLRAAADLLKPEAIIHLGDLTDGMYPLKQTLWFADHVLDGLKSIGAPVYLCIGNHDENYFRGNREVLGKPEAAAYYLGRKQPYYYIDLPDHRLRMFFLDSFNASRKQRYGFDLRQFFWFCRHLAEVPESWRILVFSHVPPLPEIHVWSDEILYGKWMLKALQYFGRRKGRSVLGWIHGHNHADQIYDSAYGKITGIGCSKLECFREHKPEGSVTQDRQKDTPSQELWDVLFIPDTEDELRFFRFGAGEDRRITL